MLVCRLSSLLMLRYLIAQAAPVAVLVLDDHVFVLGPRTVVLQDVLVLAEDCVRVNLAQCCVSVGTRMLGSSSSVSENNVK